MVDECTMGNNRSDGNGARAPATKRSGSSSQRRSKQSRTEPMSSVNVDVPDEHEVKHNALTAERTNGGPSCLLWPGNEQVFGTADERAAYFSGLQKSCELLYSSRKPCGQQASTLLDLMTIRAFHSFTLRRYSLGTALGFRTRGGEMTNIPAIIVFVARKVSAQWLEGHQILPTRVEGPGALWCDIDIVEFTFFGVPNSAPREHMYTELVDGLRGMDPCIGAGSQVTSPLFMKVASQETYGTLGAIVQSQNGKRQVGFLTNRHVAVDLDYPSQKMFHPLPPNLGQGVYLGAVERATSFIKDDLWYGVFAGMNPETYVRADGAFISFADSFDKSNITTLLRAVGPIGEVERVELQAEISSVIGRQVLKVGRSSGFTKGRVTAYAVEYNDEKGGCFFTDLLIVGENRMTFDMEGDSGSLILFTADDKADKPRPVGLIWGGTANRGRLKIRKEYGPENWTSGVDISRLLEVLQLDLITSEEALQGAILAQELAMSLPMPVPRPMILLPTCGGHAEIHFGHTVHHTVHAGVHAGGHSAEVHTRRHTGGHTLDLSPEAGEPDQGAGSQTPAAAKEPIVFSMLKGNTAASENPAEEDNEKKCILLLDLNEDKNYC